jgi:hypothetical protein
MAAFFKTSASAGVVVRAEHLFALRARPQASAGHLGCRWTRDADGRLIRDWEAGQAPHDADKPSNASSAA